MTDKARKLVEKFLEAELDGDLADTKFKCLNCGKRFKRSQAPNPNNVSCPSCFSKSVEDLSL
jgi:DNA-directed RNA polymerase subunit RPC12/RpoP